MATTKKIPKLSPGKVIQAGQLVIEFTTFSWFVWGLHLIIEVLPSSPEHAPADRVKTRLVATSLGGKHSDRWDPVDPKDINTHIGIGHPDFRNDMVHMFAPYVADVNIAECCLRVSRLLETATIEQSMATAWSTVTQRMSESKTSKSLMRPGFGLVLLCGGNFTHVPVL